MNQSTLPRKCRSRHQRLTCNSGENVVRFDTIKLLPLSSTLASEIMTVAAMSRLIHFLVFITPLIAATNEVGNQWLQDKQREANVQELPTGLLYERKQQGEGEFHPSFDSYCKIEMEVSLVKSTNELEMIETTATGEPRLVRPLDAMPAVRQAMQVMVEGDWWELYVPSHLGYVGVNSNHNIQGDEALLVTLELISIQSGDMSPKGELHSCFIELSWDRSTERYNHQPVGSCNEKDQGYIQKVTGWESRSSRADNELTRLRGVLRKGNMKQDLAQWVRRRIHILKQFLLEEMRLCLLTYRDTGFFQEDCNAQEQEYNGKVTEWESEQIEGELQRLNGLDQSFVDRALASWIRRRIRILNQVGAIKSTWTSEEAKESPPEENLNLNRNDEL